MTDEGSGGARLFRVIQPVGDVEAAARFYARALGTEGRRVSPGRHYFDCGGTLLACYDARADGDGAPAPARTEHLYFAVDDLEATWAAARAAGAVPSGEAMAGEALGEIAERPWGERSVYAADPWGNPICFVDGDTVFDGRG